MESSPWTMMGKSVRSRSISPARSAILREENSPSAPPPEASTSSTSRSQNTSGCSPRVGAGKSRARYKMPCRSWRNGEPTSRVSGCGSSSCRPILCMSGANVPPSLSVAEVAMMACSLHNRFASFPATSSGAVQSRGSWSASRPRLSHRIVSPFATDSGVIVSSVSNRLVRMAFATAVLAASAVFSPSEPASAPPFALNSVRAAFKGDRDSNRHSATASGICVKRPSSRFCSATPSEIACWASSSLPETPKLPADLAQFANILALNSVDA